MFLLILTRFEGRKDGCNTTKHEELNKLTLPYYQTLIRMNPNNIQVVHR